MNKLKIILAASLAVTLTLSCSNGTEESSGSGSSGGAYAQVYTLKEVTPDQFTYVDESEYAYCGENGAWKTDKDSYEKTINYSITNNIMTWKEEYGEDTLNFKGTSNELIGTWTRKKDRNASCELRTKKYCRGDEHYDPESDDYVCENNNYEEESDYSCKDNWRLTEVVFTATTVKITGNYCVTDRMIEQTAPNGWKQKPINCDTYEMSKGSDKVTVKENRKTSTYEVSYKGKSCKRSEPSDSKKAAACKKAYDEHPDDQDWREYYYQSLEKEFDDCMKRILPAELLKEDEEDASGKIAAKSVAKAEFMPLLKKRN